MPKPHKCPYCKQVRRTQPGMLDHVKKRHPWNISPAGILLPNKESTISHSIT